MTQPSRRTPPTSSQANLSATASRGRVDNNPKSASKTGAKKPAGKAGRPQAKDNTKLYIGIGVGGGALLLIIIISVMGSGDTKVPRTKAVTSTKPTPYDPLASYKKLSPAEKMRAYQDMLALDKKIDAFTATLPEVQSSSNMEQMRSQSMARQAKIDGYSRPLVQEIMSKYKLTTKNAYEQIGIDGVNGNWK